MSNKSFRNDPHLNSYHHTDSLLFQFILAEFLKAFSILIKIEKMRAHNYKPEPFISNIRQLSGVGIGLQRYFPWNPDEGVLVKLKSYVDYLSEKWSSSPDSKIISDLQKSVHQLWNHSIDTLETLESNGLESFPAKFDKVQHSAQKLKKALAKAIPCFKDDENSIFFIIRHHTAFTSIYGSEFAAKLLDKIYPGGLKEARNFLQQAYTRRKFAHLLPSIKTFLNHLEGVK